MKNNQQKLILNNIMHLSNSIRRLALHCNFMSKSKSINEEYVKKELENVKLSIKNLEKYL